MKANSFTILVTCGALAALAGAGPSQAADAGEMAAESLERAVEAGFSELERQIIERYFGRAPAQVETGTTTGDTTGKGERKHGKKDKGMPPGLAKRDTLPPGLARRETLPPGLAKRDLPEDLEQQLPPVRDGYERQVVGEAAVVLLERATGRVVDIINDIIIADHHD